jgi:hypothetical protein
LALGGGWHRAELKLRPYAWNDGQGPRTMRDDAEDRSTWPRNGQTIRRDELLRLIQENGGPVGLDLRGAEFVGDGRDVRLRKRLI